MGDRRQRGSPRRKSSGGVQLQIGVVAKGGNALRLLRQRGGDRLKEFGLAADLRQSCLRNAGQYRGASAQPGRSGGSVEARYLSLVWAVHRPPSDRSQR